MMCLACRVSRASETRLSQVDEDSRQTVDRDVIDGFITNFSFLLLHPPPSITPAAFFMACCIIKNLPGRFFATLLWRQPDNLVIVAADIAGDVEVAVGTLRNGAQTTVGAL